MPVVRDTLVTVPEVPVEFAMPLREVEVMVMEKYKKMGLLDEGSEIVIIRGDLCDKLGVEMNMKRKMTMQIANGGKEEMQGCIEYLELEVGGVKTYAHAFVVQSIPYQLLLGRPWQKGMKLGKIKQADRSVEVEISDPKEEIRWVVVPMRERMGKRLKGSMLTMEEKGGESGDGGLRLDEEPNGSGYGEDAKTLLASVSMGVGTGGQASKVTGIEVARNRDEKEWRIARRRSQ